jgi:hypothetical protein
MSMPFISEINSKDSIENNLNTSVKNHNIALNVLGISNSKKNATPETISENHPIFKEQKDKGSSA